ncbi:NAD(P)-dependent oxidoreductase [Verrucomicrobiaceae bacterium SCGC AG-212-N21]|nr:NAD(P)-dependent oxidoreductase [Verrucomicrobiaceae bacterium SCGC AG-212-N21]
MPGLPPARTHRTVPSRIGIVGTGFIAVGLCLLLRTVADLTVSRVLTRRTIDAVTNLPGMPLTRSLDDLLENSDLVVECSGDIIHASNVVDAALNANLPVVTMGAEFHVTVGSHFCSRGVLTEAEGDQPGSLAALREEALSMGFEPLVYGNIKGFLNENPSQTDMAYWSERNGISIPQVTSFTDGTKLQIEQALVANGLNADIVQPGMLGLNDMPLHDAGLMLGQEAKLLGSPISDYVLNPKLPAGVFITAEHPTERPEVLRYLKLGDGPCYTLLRPYHLCHLEMPRTIRRVLEGRGPLLNNSATPRVNVVAIAKRDLPAGHRIGTAIGGTEFRGQATRYSQSGDAPPIGLLNGARLRHSVAAGQMIAASDVDVPDSIAKKAWEHVMDGMLACA